MENIGFGTAQSADLPVFHPVVSSYSTSPDTGTARQSAAPKTRVKVGREPGTAQRTEAVTAKKGGGVKAEKNSNEERNSIVKGAPDSRSGAAGEKAQAAGMPEDNVAREENKASVVRGTTAKFDYDEKINRITITISDRENGEVIKEIPPEDTRKMLERLHKMTGVFLNEEV